MVGYQPIAAAITGTFTSHFAERPSPLFGESTSEDDAAKANRTGRTLKTSNAEARLVVVGTSEFTSDLVTQMGQQIGGGTYRGNILSFETLWIGQSQIRICHQVCGCLRADAASTEAE